MVLDGRWLHFGEFARHVQILSFDQTLQEDPELLLVVLLHVVLQLVLMSVLPNTKRTLFNGLNAEPLPDQVPSHFGLNFSGGNLCFKGRRHKFLRGLHEWQCAALVASRLSLKMFAVVFIEFIQ